VVRSAGNSTYNFDNPVIRDVVSIGNTGDNVTIRFFTDNPGPWFFHCHIDWHLTAFVICPSLCYCVMLTHHPSGFAVVFAEDVPDVPQQDFVNSTLTDFRL
jgi:iron transport multicopper oxidase